jgi:2-polyprenyl-3-methyl-5-hydroxy-6-metoxy-1,4-benzoquinol methylase
MNLVELSSGGFDEEPLRSFIANDPWGENPLPYLTGLRWSYVRCADCHQAFHKYILSPAWNEIRFSKWMSAAAIQKFEDAKQTPVTRFQSGRERTKHVLALELLTRPLRGSNPVRILDFGCGNGDFLTTCELHGFEVLGVDRSAARRGNARVPIVSSLEEIDGLFHAVTLFEVLEHLDDPRSVIESLRERLMAGGILVLETPDATGVTHIASKSDSDKIFPLDHINGFTPRTLRDFAVRLRFESMQRPIAQVNCGFVRVVKTEARRMLQTFLPLTTQQYFRKNVDN